MQSGKRRGVRNIQGILLRRGGYTLLRLLATIASAGEAGIPTRKLLDEIGTHAIQELIDKAEKDWKLIERTDGGRTEGTGRFEPKVCRLTKKGLTLLQSQLPQSRPQD